MQVTLRRATVDDIAFLLALGKSSPSAAHWSERQYVDLFAPEVVVKRLVLIAEKSKEVLGFLIARHLPPEWELENIVVTPGARRQGIGKQLLQALLAAALETNGESVFLEVRESNAAARNLYETAGFAPTGRRTAYYSDPPEDAILYRYIPGQPISL